LNVYALANPTVIVVAIVYGALLRLASAAGLFGIVLWVMISLSLWRYCYAVLRNVARGWKNFPPPDLESTNPFGAVAVVLHYLFFATLSYLLVTTPLIGLPVRALLLCVVAIGFPASAAVMGMTNSLVAALNPLSVRTVAAEFGADYVKLVALCVLLVALGFVSERLASVSWLLGVVGDIFSVWTSLALFLAIGAALRVHRFDFDLLEGVDDTEQRDERERRAAWQKTLDRAYASARSGLASQAYRTVKELIASESDSLEIYQWTFNGMLAWDEPHHAALLGERFAARLWEAGRKIDALDLAQRCRKLSPKFVPPAAFLTELATYAREIGRHRLADELGEIAMPERSPAP